MGSGLLTGPLEKTVTLEEVMDSTDVPTGWERKCASVPNLASSRGLKAG